MLEYLPQCLALLRLRILFRLETIVPFVDALALLVCLVILVIVAVDSITALRVRHVIVIFAATPILLFVNHHLPVPPR